MKPLLAQLQHFFAIFAFAVAHNRGQEIGAGSLLHAHNAVDHVLNLLRLNGQTCCGAIGRADPRKQQAHIVVNLGHGSHRGTGVFRGGFLLNGNRGRQPRDVIHVGLLHHVKELPRIGAEAFDIAALPFGIDRVKGQ